jgi:hypothetical protein
MPAPRTTVEPDRARYEAAMRKAEAEARAAHRSVKEAVHTAVARELFADTRPYYEGGFDAWRKAGMPLLLDFTWDWQWRAFVRLGGNVRTVRIPAALEEAARLRRAEAAQQD